MELPKDLIEKVEKIQVFNAQKGDRVLVQVSKDSNMILMDSFFRHIFKDSGIRWGVHNGQIQKIEVIREGKENDGTTERNEP